MFAFETRNIVEIQRRVEDQGESLFILNKISRTSQTRNYIFNSTTALNQLPKWNSFKH